MSSSFSIHGATVTVAEHPGPGCLDNVNGIAWTDIVGLRQGWGSSFRGCRGTFNWFHIPVPTPVVLQDVPSSITGLSVLFDVEAGARVNSVHVWGPRRNRWFTSDNLGALTDLRFSFDPPVRVDGAIGLSIGVQFDETANITFRGASIELA